MLSRNPIPPLPPSTTGSFSHLLSQVTANRPTWLASLVAALAAWISFPVMPAQAGEGPTVKDLVEMTRIGQPGNHEDEDLQKQISPDREQAFVITRKSNVATDVNRYQLVWLDLSKKRREASNFVPPVTLLTVDSLQDEKDLNPSVQDVRWVSNRTIVFRARMNDEPFQVYRLDVQTRQLTQLTFAPLGLVAFDLTRDMKRVVYVAPVLNSAVPPGARSVVVGTNSFWDVHWGQLGVRYQKRRFQFFVADAQSRGPARPLGESFAESMIQYPRPSISPDGQWAAMQKPEPDRATEWGKHYAQVAEAMARAGDSRKLDPLNYFSRATHYRPQRFVVYRLSDGAEQTIVDAPDDATLYNIERTDRLWQDGGQTVVIAGTYLPPKAGESASDAASHIIQYWPVSQRWKDIAVLKHRLKSAQPVADDPSSFIAIDGDTARRFQKAEDGSWREVAVGATLAAQAGSVLLGNSSSGALPSADALPPDWHLHVEESLNQPPDIVAQGPGGAVVRLTDLNPGYEASKWGTMRTYDWKDAKGRTWHGGLMVPKSFDPKQRHALVIQTYGFSPTRFYRDGSNTYDAFTSGFPGRALLRENILVLAVPLAVPPASGNLSELSTDAKAFMVQDGVRAAVDELVAKGMVDRNRIGIIGWSATGEQVLNMITFSDIPIRAASMVDGDANTLFSLTITYSVNDSTQVRKEVINGGGAFGTTLQSWVDRDPSLHTDCIKAAVRIESYGIEVNNNWDIYSLLRRQYKPAEFIVIPGGAHQLSRPSERMISLQGNVDWFKFWLNGEKRSEVLVPGETLASLNDQYVRWNQMADLKAVDEKKPRCTAVASKR